jgi:hypothetical protein
MNRWDVRTLRLPRSSKTKRLTKEATGKSGRAPLRHPLAGGAIAEVDPRSGSGGGHATNTEFVGTRDPHPAPSAPPSLFQGEGNAAARQRDKLICDSPAAIALRSRGHHAQNQALPTAARSSATRGSKTNRRSVSPQLSHRNVRYSNPGRATSSWGSTRVRRISLPQTKHFIGSSRRPAPVSHRNGPHD